MTEGELFEKAFEAAAKEMKCRYLSPACAVFLVHVANCHTDMVVHAQDDGALQVQAYCKVHDSGGFDEDEARVKISEHLEEFKERYAACAQEIYERAVNEAIAIEEEFEDGFHDD